MPPNNVNEPLLSSPTEKSASPCRAPSLFLCFIALISATAFVAIQLTDNTITVIPLQPSDLCISSPRPTSCQDIVSRALLGAGTANLRRSSTYVFRYVLQRSLSQANAAMKAATAAAARIDEPGLKSALSDCVQLMDDSRDRILSSASAAAVADARTWMSAVLTNQDTCLDGLRGAAESALQPHLESLGALVSASLAVLNAVEAASERERSDDFGGGVVKALEKFPSWLSNRDREFLEITSANAIKADVVVAKDGSGKYKTVQEAVDSVPDRNKKRFVIYVKKGVYKENVSVGKKKTYVTLVGDGMDATVITGSLNVIDGSTTFNSATLAADADGLILQDLKIENTAGPEKHQAVALRVSGDQSIINRCRLDGYQDTLYTHKNRQFFRDCSVSGTVDFIFGNAAVVLQNCTLVARLPMSNQQNLVTAQGRTDPNQNTATSIHACRIVPSDDLAPVANSIKSYLGRPWKEYSRTVVMQSYIGGHIDAKGWLEWDGNFALKTLFYGEYQNRGPGAGTSGRVTWPGYKVITDENTATAFTVGSLIQGASWLTGAGVEFTEGLIS